jgi:hypothetical protein
MTWSVGNRMVGMKKGRPRRGALVHAGASRRGEDVFFAPVVLKTKNGIYVKAIPDHAFAVAGDGEFPAEAEVEIFQLWAAGAGADGEGDEGAINFGIGSAEVEEVAPFESDEGGDGAADLIVEALAAIAAAHDAEDVGFEHGEKPVGEGVADVEAVVEDGAFGIAVDGNFEAELIGELPAIPEFEDIDGGDEFAVAGALKDLLVAHGDFVDELEIGGEIFFGFVEPGVFDAGGDVGPAADFREGMIWAETDVAVLGGVDGEAFIESDLNLDGVSFDVTADGDIADDGIEGAGEAVVGEEGVDGGLWDGEIEEGGIGDGPTGIGEGFWRLDDGGDGIFIVGDHFSGVGQRGESEGGGGECEQ